MTAFFPLISRAAKFEIALLTNPAGWYATDIKREGRKVMWTVVLPDTNTEGIGVYERDLLDTVGYYGSDQRCKATLNGIAAPMVY